MSYGAVDAISSIVICLIILSVCWECMLKSKGICDIHCYLTDNTGLLSTHLLMLFLCHAISLTYLLSVISFCASILLCRKDHN